MILQENKKYTILYIERVTVMFKFFTNKNKKKAFTLAEVLITLGIIGVLASLAMPNLITDYRGKELEARLKDNYTTLQNAVMYANASSNKAYSSDQWFNVFIKNRINITSECTVGVTCFANLKYLNKSEVRFEGLTRVLPDGSHILIGTSTWLYSHYGVKINNYPNDNFNGVVIIMDVNGDKLPNIVGNDIYILVWNGKRLVPAGYDRSYTEVEQNCSVAQGGNGMWCMQKVITDGWKISREVLRK